LKAILIVYNKTRKETVIARYDNSLELKSDG